MSDSNIPDGNKSAEGQNSIVTDGDENKKPKQVSYDTYDKAMASLSKEKQRAKDLELQLQKIQEDKMIADGNKDQVIETYKKRFESLEEITKRDKAERMLERFQMKVAEVGARKGVKNPTIAQKLFSIKEFNLDESGNVDVLQLESKFDGLRNTDSYLFSNGDKRIADGNPQLKPAVDMNKPLNQMTVKELEDLYIKKGLQG